jgi:hypothetical protein
MLVNFREIQGPLSARSGTCFIAGAMSFSANDIVEYINDLRWSCSPSHGGGIHFFERVDDVLIMKRDIRLADG